MRVELINTGSELLIGTVVNTHAAWLARELLALGLRISRQVTVPDGSAIREALAEAIARAEVVLVTGGLGPTSDDVTRNLAAELLGRPLVHDPEVEAAIRERFARRKLSMPASVLRQAQVPAGARVLPNGNGTAPGLHLAPGPRCPAHLFLLPGPPRELHPMFREQVIPTLRALSPQAIPECRILRIAGMGESQVEEAVGEALVAIEGLELGYCARPGEVDVRLVGPAPIVARAEAEVRTRLGIRIFGEGAETMEDAVVTLLTRTGKTLAVAESCTGGFLSHRITNVAGASAVFLVGYVTYANPAKQSALGIPPELLATHGAVSEAVARAMAEGALARAGSDYALATTGIAGPGGGLPGKPVGTLHLALASAGLPTLHRSLLLSADRETFKFMATQSALDLLRMRLSGNA